MRRRGAEGAEGAPLRPEPARPPRAPLIRHLVALLSRPLCVAPEQQEPDTTPRRTAY